MNEHAKPDRAAQRSKRLDAEPGATAHDGQTGPRPPAYRRAAPIKFPKSAPVEAVAAAVFAASCRQWRANEAAALDGRQPEGIHQLRVGLRRAKSAATLFKSALTADQFHWITAEASWALSVVADARDWDVFIGELLQPVQHALPGETTLTMLAGAAADARTHAYQTARVGLRSSRYAHFCADFEGFLADGLLGDVRRTDGQSIRPVATELLSQRHRKAMKRGRGLATLPAAERHRVRIVLKKLRYAVEFFGSLYPAKTTAAYKRSLKRMQNNLGHLNDIAVADRLLVSLPIPLGDAKALGTASGIVRGWYAQRLVQVEPVTLADWRRLRRAKPFWE